MKRKRRMKSKKSRNEFRKCSRCNAIHRERHHDSLCHDCWEKKKEKQK